MTEIEILQANSDEWKRRATELSGEVDDARREVINLQARLKFAEAVCEAVTQKRRGFTPEDRWRAPREIEQTHDAYLVNEKRTKKPNEEGTYFLIHLVEK